MSIVPVYGLPGLRAAIDATPRNVFMHPGWEILLPGGRVIDGLQSRDPGNTGAVNVLRAGLLMGKITTSNKYAPAFVGVTSGAYTSGGTSLTVSAAAAVELDRLVGQSGTAELVAIGPPTANGTVATTDITHSAINTTSGAITVTSLGVDKVAGTFIAVKDGRQTPITMIGDRLNAWGLRVTDTTDTGIDVEFAELPISGLVITANLLPAWPSDTSLQDWIFTGLNTNGKFIRDDKY